jgi:glycosyltransferase involved in cell wall biosynthesis
MTRNSEIPLERPLGLLVKVFPKLSETFVLEEVLGLERLGLSLRLYALADASDAIQHAAVGRIAAAVVRVPALSMRTPGQWAGFALRHLRQFVRAPWRYACALCQAAQRGRAGWADFARAGWLASRLRDDGVQHLHTHFISTPADVAELVSKLSGMPFSISAHAKDIYLADAADLRRKLEAARFTVTCTEFNCRRLCEAAPRAQVQRMYHGIDLGVFHPRVRRATGLAPLILSVGRLRAKKGLDTLIDACRLLRDRDVLFRCEIVGYGEEQARLQALIERDGLGDRVTLSGKLVREDVIERYARAAVYVQPSRIAADGDRDGIPNVLLEAMAVGLPVVASRVSGIPELVRHRDNGLLVAADDALALADSIAELIGDPGLCAQLGRQARAMVSRHFDNSCNLQLLLSLLRHSHPHATLPVHRIAA